MEVEQNFKTIAVLITNVNGGGTLRHARELAHAWGEQGCKILFIQVTGSITYVSYLEKGILIRNHFFIDDKEGKRLQKLLVAYQVQLLHVEHLLEAPDYFLALHERLGVPLVIVMHDYYMICPFIKMTDENEYYCGENSIANCQKCLSRRKIVCPTTKRRVMDIIEWRKMWEKYLESAALVIVPSVDMEERVKRYYPNLKLEMKENPELISNKSSVKQIGLIGNLSIAKGSKKIKECLTYCSTHHLDFHFILFGTLPDITLSPEEKKYITVLGPYEEERIYSQILEKQIDFFWFPGVCPETYSYTLTIPIRLGIPCVSTDLGAIASRITQNNWGKIYPWQYNAKQILYELGNFSYEKYKNPDFVIHNTTFGNISEYYHDLKALPTGVVQPNLFPRNDSVMKLTRTYKQEEFHALWQIAHGKEKLYLILHIDWKWVNKVLQEKGIGYLRSRIFSKYI